MSKSGSSHSNALSVSDQVAAILRVVKKRDGHEPEFIQALEETVQGLLPLFEQRPQYVAVLRALVEPERVVQFRVSWEDDAGQQHINRGWRVQMNSALGPYKGGLRLHETVNLGVLKFLAFEQTFKNALTTLPMGSGKGGSDFSPKGRSEAEVRRFCRAFMGELSRHIGPNVDVPAGDIGVGGREIGYLLGQYKQNTREASGGVLTGKGVSWGGSLVRTEATGYGLVYFTDIALRDRDDTLEGKRVLVSGSGNVAQYCVAKLIELGAKPITLSDSSGTVVEPNGFTVEQLKAVQKIKNEQRGRIREYAEQSDTAEYHDGKSVWDLGLDADIAMPCATQNEIHEEHAQLLIDHGVKVVAEGANMPSTNDAISKLKDADVFFLPAKACNAGGVATSLFEMSQNSKRMSDSFEEVDQHLKEIMQSIFDQCKSAAEKLDQPGDIQLGANAAGFIRVAEGMLAQGFAYST